MADYRIVESVGAQREPVTRWSDIEHHHPSNNLQEAGRVYASVGGRPEEVAGNYRGAAIYTPGGQLMVSKDMVLLDAGTGLSRIQVPSPANGYIGEVRRSSGTVTILDRPGGEQMFLLRHLAIDDNLRPGSKVEYGQPLGMQSGYGNGRPDYYRPHLHIDVNVRYLEQADRYVRDMASGAITTERRPESTTNLVNEVPVIEPIRGRFPPPPVQALTDGRIEQGERGPDVALLQEGAAGARNAQGGEIIQDGDFGAGTRQAVEHFQRANNLPVTGVADPETLDRLGVGVQQQGAGFPAPAVGPSPSDHPLLERIREGVRGLDRQAGKDWDESSERLSASLLVKATEKGFGERDELRFAFNTPTAALRGGEVVHMTRQGDGASVDPYLNRAHVVTSEALSIPLEDSYRLAQSVQRSQAEAWQRDQQALDASQRTGPTIG